MILVNPLLVGYTNPTYDPDANKPGHREKVYLTESDLITHLHGIGATRSGKSKWLEWFCRGLAMQRIGFTLIDPQGTLAKDLVSYFAYLMPSQPIIYFNPSRTDFLVPFNPFTRGRGDKSVRVSRQIQATIRVWGAASLDDTPRLGRVMRTFYHLFSTGEITLNELDELTLWEYKELREHAANLLPEGTTAYNEWKSFMGYRRKEDFETQMESTRNRLAPFIDFPQIRRIMSLEEPNLNFEEIFDTGTILIANLGQSPYFADENARLIGSLMIHELWQAAQQRETSPQHPYFLLVDEFQKFLTPDIRDILDRGAGKGLHLGLFHQHLGQLEEQDKWTYDSVMTNAKTKVVFGGLSKPDARTLVDEMFADQIPYDETKFLIEQTKFWPTYTRDTTYSKTRGRGMGSASGTGNIAGQAWNPILDEWVPTEGTSDFESRSDYVTWSEGESDVPIFYPVPFKEITSVETYNLEEQRNRFADQLKEQYQRHYFIKRPGQQTIPAATPYVAPFKTFPETEEAYVLDHFIKPFGLSVAEIDEMLEGRRQRLIEKALNPSPELEEPTSWRRRSSKKPS